MSVECFGDIVIPFNLVDHRPISVHDHQLVLRIIGDVFDGENIINPIPVRRNALVHFDVLTNEQWVKTWIAYADGLVSIVPPGSPGYGYRIGLLGYPVLCGYDCTDDIWSYGQCDRIRGDMVYYRRAVNCRVFAGVKIDRSDG